MSTDDEAKAESRSLNEEAKAESPAPDEEAKTEPPADDEVLNQKLGATIRAVEDLRAAIPTPVTKQLLGALLDNLKRLMSCVGDIERRLEFSLQVNDALASKDISELFSGATTLDAALVEAADSALYAYLDALARSGRPGDSCFGRQAYGCLGGARGCHALEVAQLHMIVWLG